MKVILTADVQGSGKKGDVVEVSEGYAKNFLLKKGLAKQATQSGIKEVELKKKAEAFHKAEEVKAAKELAAEIKGKSFNVAIKTGENGKLFGSVTSLQIAQAIAAGGYDVDKKKILLDSPIKAIGEATVKIRLMEGIETSVKINVVPEE